MTAGSMDRKAGPAMPAAARGRSRPNDMKAAPIMAAVDVHMARGGPVAFEQLLVHTGQHSDRVLSELFFEEPGLLPRTDVNPEASPWRRAWSERGQGS